MRAPSKYALKSMLGETRVVRKFLLIPRCFDGDTTWRWLEYAYVVETVKEVDVGGTMEWGNYAYKWVETGFSYLSSAEVA